MDNIMNNAYQKIVGAVANTLDAKETSGGQVTGAIDSVVENLKQRWELFRFTCDQAHEFLSLEDKTSTKKLSLEESEGCFPQ
ncbi:mediator of RNA polymerase II transcription subunit 32 [Tanacetum coccineum]|uniref:Mediator of RNA polymerase II transcription subunit 32 n=1 Tax=Tanacetum coccineum TaxID=301880 RepID=A0ABQ5EYC6_9ASTR